MPLQKLQFRPGVNRESTTLANEGGWFDSDKVRWRSGYPEKIGGWTKDAGSENTTAATGTFVGSGTTTSAVPQSGTFWGVCRSMFNWLTLAGYNLLGLGTNLKFYIQSGTGGTFYDVTPIRDTATAVANAFTTDTTTNSGGYTTVTVNDTGHGAQTNDFVNISAVSGPVNSITAAALTNEFQITYVDSDHYTIRVAGTASASSTPAVSATFDYELTSGGDVFTRGVGWGAGGWGGTTAGYPSTGWGSPAPAGLGIGVQLRTWSQSNFGQDLIINPRGGSIYYWAVNSNVNTYDRAQKLVAGGTISVRGSSVSIDSTCPSLVNEITVSDASRFVIAFGCNPINSAGTGIESYLDPLLVRWSDQESVGTWTPAVTNQAGDYRLSQGSEIVAYLQTRQEILIWTDAAVYSMQYVGAPYVWSFQIMGTNTSIMGPNVVATANNVTYWMGTDKFYMYSGRVETLPCTLRQYVFDDINLEQSYQFFAGTNEGYNEVWWFYCSANSTIIDKYVIFNHLERTWYYGTLERTAWLDSPLRASPMAAGYGFCNFTGSISSTTLTVTNIYAGNLVVGSTITGTDVPDGTTITALGTGTGGIGTYTVSTISTVASEKMVGISPQGSGILVYHEDGVDDGTTNPPSAIEAYCQSSDFDIGDGHNFGFVWRIIPDVTFDGSTVNNPAVVFTVRPRQNPGANYGSTDEPNVVSTQNYTVQQTYNVQQFTEYAYVRIRGRQMAFKISSSDVGVSWQLGAPRLELRPDGRR